MLDISVIIPAYNAAHTLGDCLQALNAQSLAPARREVIVADDCSTDATGEVARSFGAQVVKTVGNSGPGAARNCGMAVAQGKWIAFIDADCLPTRHWLRKLLAACAAAGDNVAGAAGPVTGYQAETSAARFIELGDHFDTETHLKHPVFPYPYSANAMYRTDLLRQVGGFDERYRIYGSPDLHHRVMTAAGEGARYLYVPHAVVLHRHRSRWRDYWRQQYGYGCGYADFLLHYRDRFPWSFRQELRAWLRVAGLALPAAWPGGGDAGLVRRGTFIRQLSQRLGFAGTYWSRRERAKWTQ
jgi:glycosyltransferase involved in cell wall biosynthesis